MNCPACGSDDVGPGFAAAPADDTTPPNSVNLQRTAKCENCSHEWVPDADLCKKCGADLRLEAEILALQGGTLDDLDQCPACGGSFRHFVRNVSAHEPCTSRIRSSRRLQGPTHPVARPRKLNCLSLIDAPNHPAGSVLHNLRSISRARLSMIRAV